MSSPVATPPRVAPPTSGGGRTSGGHHAPPPTALVALALGLVYVIWGSTYLGIRVAVEDIPPLTMVSVRFLVAGAILWVVARRGLPAAERPTRRQWAATAVVGILLLGVGNGGIAVAEQYVPTGLVALLVATVPLWMALLGRVVLGDRLTRVSMVSLGIGFAGVALLVSPGSAAPPLTMLAVLVSPLAWSAGSVFARRCALPRRALLVVAMEMLAAGAALAVPAVATGELGRIPRSALGWHPLLAMAYLITFGSFLGYTAYTWLLQRVPLPLVSTYAYVNPFVALLLGALFLGEGISRRTVAGGLVVAVAVALLLSRQGRPGGTARGDGHPEVGPVGQATSLAR